VKFLFANHILDTERRELRRGSRPVAVEPVGQQGTILATTDGGATWQKRDSGVSTTLYGVHSADPTHGWAVGQQGTILATTDGGATWKKRDSGVSTILFGVHFADPTHGWAVGDKRYDPRN
jgi:photosystem II stability/assembly factor-like uncharacterized protein